MIDPLFAPAKAEKVFGTVPAGTGRYHMPLLPGEQGVKAGGDWVPRGCRRMTNHVGAFEDARALSIWEQAMGLIGLALDESLYEELVLLVEQARREGVDFSQLREHKELSKALAGNVDKQDESIIGRAKHLAGASKAAQRGTNRHTAWEHRGQTGELIGTKSIQAQLLETERLLAEAGLVRVPDLQERVVRNTDIDAVGKFDDILMETATGRLLMADLKSKARAFYSYTTVDGQLAGYARSRWMLRRDGQGYEDGPLHYVDQSEGVILHVPSDGGPARLERADLVNGWRVCLVAKEVLELRAYGKGGDRMSRQAWQPITKDLALTS